MNYLIDTHVLLWVMLNPSKLSDKAKSIIKDRKNGIYISKISLWEIAIKIKIGKLEINMDFNRMIKSIIDNDIEILDLSTVHITETLKLPFHHRDPFDRLLIAQAKFEDFIFITKDEKLKKYKIKILWG